MPAAALWLMWPIENIINERYKSLAAAKLAGRPDLIRIGITGSYGKTSTKFILDAILSEKYDVLASPSSINTPMGLTILIREQLEQHHQVFIAEMGARRAGEIRELAELVKPRYGVITSIGPQHLETFGSLENIAKTKFELIEELPGDGVGFFGADDGETDALYERAACEKYRAGIGGGFLYMRAEDIEAGEFGSRFTLCDNEGNRAACVTKLLGRHNIANIVLCGAVAARLGMTMEQIARGVKRVRPIEHRLMLMRGENGESLVIDDAFNSNPAGAKAALDVLSQFKSRRRLIVTPGMVELGEKQNDLNYIFGAQIAACCDIAVLVGSSCSRAIARGAVDSGMNIESIHFVPSLKDAAALLQKIGIKNDIILFENDLPDNYS
jgi:UDP-N-acetylmuramoyl-tripeptide--D-alanyl-D-alanine ligase